MMLWRHQAAHGRAISRNEPERTISRVISFGEILKPCTTSVSSHEIARDVTLQEATEASKDTQRICTSRTRHERDAKKTKDENVAECMHECNQHDRVFTCSQHVRTMSLARGTHHCGTGASASHCFTPRGKSSLEHASGSFRYSVTLGVL